jgi:hypothetical protein
MLAAGSKVGYKAFTLIPNDPLTDEGPVKAKIATAEKMPLLGKLLSAVRRLSGNVRKHSLECFSSRRIGVFLRLGYFALSGRFSLGRFHFLRNHSSTIRILRTQQALNTVCQSAHTVRFINYRSVFVRRGHG